MKKTDLEKSIILIGPSSVGKSLLAPELANKLGYKYFNIDDFMCIVNCERGGSLGPTKREQNNFINYQLAEMLNYGNPSLLIPSYYDETKQLIKEFIELYKYYLDMFGSLKPFYQILEQHEIMQDNLNNIIDGINSLSITSSEILKMALPMISEPLVIDAPAPVGWNTDNVKINRRIYNALRCYDMYLDMPETRKTLNTVLDNTTTVFLYPGRDYRERNAAQKIQSNKILLHDLEAYNKHAKIVVSTNGIFNEPTNPFLKVRAWFEPKSEKGREKIKNKNEIQNVCDQIIDLRHDLLESEKKQI